MKQRVALLLVGILVGALVMTMLPVQAHHGADFRRLRRQVNVLKQKTQFMDRGGFYSGPILEGQVVSFDCLDGDPAVWTGTDFGFQFLFCSDGPASVRFSQKMIREFRASIR